MSGVFICNDGAGAHDAGSVGSHMICCDWQLTIGDVHLELKLLYPTLPDTC